MYPFELWCTLGSEDVGFPVWHQVDAFESRYAFVGFIAKLHWVHDRHGPGCIHDLIHDLTDLTDCVCHATQRNLWTAAESS